ncbi:MAG: hypothetical protein Q7S75_01795 [bacterium]|nr:hypothetical protein [bacterium]
METSSTKKLIARKFANALIGDAAGREGVLTALAWTQGTFDIHTGRMADTSLGLPTTKGLMKMFSKHYGGLWVGGTLSLFEDSLHFEANAMNKALQTGSTSVDIPLESIVRASPRFGFVTGIIDVVWTKDSMQYLNSFRCFGSKAFLAKIENAVQSAKTKLSSATV